MFLESLPSRGRLLRTPFASRRTRFAIHDTRFPASWMHSLVGPPRPIGFYTRFLPCRRPTVHWAEHTHLCSPGERRSCQRQMRGPVSSGFSTRSLGSSLDFRLFRRRRASACHALTLAYTCRSLSGLSSTTAFHNKVFISLFYWSDVYSILILKQTGILSSLGI